MLSICIITLEDDTDVTNNIIHVYGQIQNEAIQHLTLNSFLTSLVPARKLYSCMLPGLSSWFSSDRLRHCEKLSFKQKANLNIQAMPSVPNYKYICIHYIRQNIKNLLTERNPFKSSGQYITIKCIFKWPDWPTFRFFVSGHFLSIIIWNTCVAIVASHRSLCP